MIFLPREMFESEEEYEECRRIRERPLDLIKEPVIWTAELCRAGNILILLFALGDRWGPWSGGMIIKVRVPRREALGCSDKPNACEAIPGRLAHKELSMSKILFVVG